MAMVRSAGVHGFRTLVVELGGDADDIARRAGLPLAAMERSDALVPDTAVAMALEIAAAELSCPDFGLRMARRQDLNLLGPLGLAVKHSESLATALRYLSDFLFVHAEGLRIRAVPDPLGSPDVAGVEFDAGPDRLPTPQATALVLGFAHRAAVELVGGPYGLRSVELPHDPPAPEAYAAHFGGPVRGGRPSAVVRITGNLASMLLRDHDEELQRLALAMLARHRREPGDDVVQLVRTALTHAMGRTPMTITAVARQLSVHPRTLQRLLAAAGTSFAEVLDDLRRHTARQLLTGTDLPVAQVAHRVGYAEAATFSRRARAWWGTTPVQVRHGAAPAAEMSPSDNTLS